MVVRVNVYCNVTPFGLVVSGCLHFRVSPKRRQLYRTAVLRSETRSVQKHACFELALDQNGEVRG